MSTLKFYEYHSFSCHAPHLLTSCLSFTQKCVSNTHLRCSIIVPTAGAENPLFICNCLVGTKYPFSLRYTEYPCTCLVVLSTRLYMFGVITFVNFMLGNGRYCKYAYIFLLFENKIIFETQEFSKNVK